MLEQKPFLSVSGAASLVIGSLTFYHGWQNTEWDL